MITRIRWTMAVVGTATLAGGCGTDAPPASVVGAAGQTGTGGDAAGEIGGQMSGCAAGQTLCGGVCVDTSSDPANCSGCGVACGAGMGCVGGVCTCPAGSADCGGQCVDVLNDASNCGGCGVACPVGQLCQAGSCVCQAGLMLCSGACVDVLRDSTNCGGCGIVCATGEVCSVGQCTAGPCAAGLTLCGSDCVDLGTSPFHCGSCNNACPGGQSCIGGSCVCPTGQQLCSGACVDTQSDSLNCGSCGAQCAAGESCVAGACTAAGTGGSGGATGGTGGTTGGTGGTTGGTGGTTGGTAGTDCTPPTPGSTGTNPLFTDQYTADPAPLVHDCTFYIVCGHDEGNTGFVLNEWLILKSTDMVNWTKSLGMTLSVFSWAYSNAWASQMVERDGRFYWYVPVAEGGNGAMAIGVAVADSPEGPFTDAIGGPLVNDAFEMSNMGFATPEDTPYTIDPTVFVDDDGQAYLQYGGFWRMITARLNPDMISIDGQMQESTPQGFFEAPFLFKRDGVYYEVYARDANPATIDWATSNSPMGPWSYGGRILDTLPNVPGQDAATNHAGVAEFAGQWYLVYHVSDGPNNGGTYRREVAIEKLFFNADGSIQHVTPSSGLTF